MKVDLRSLDESSAFNLYLSNYLLPKLGTTKHSYEEFSELLQLSTSGLNMSVNYECDPSNPQHISPFLVFTISCLDKNLSKMFDMLGEFLTEMDIKDYEHISNQIRMESSAAAGSVLQSPLEYAIDYGVSSQRAAQQFYNKLGNVSVRPDSE